MKLLTKRTPQPPVVASTSGGRHVLVHPSGASYQRIEAMPLDFRPKHCAGANTHPSGCLHLHPGDEACGCGQAVLPPDDDGGVVLQVRPHDSMGKTPGPFIRHSLEGCHEVSPSAAQAVSV